MVHPITEANETSPFGTLTPEQFYARHAVAHAGNYITNSRGLKLFTQSWTPLPPTEVVGVICVVHGYSGESSWFVQLTSVHLAKAGFAVCAIDHQGHGFSEGLQLHIPDINPVVDDCIAFFNSFRGDHAPSLPSFLYSESLGGAIALLITLRYRDGAAAAGGRPYDGVVLNGAMCGISASYKSPWPLEHFLSVAAALIPTWRVVPTRGSIPSLVQAGMEAQAGDGQPEEVRGAATGLHGPGAPADLQGGAGPVRGGGRSVPDHPWRRRRRLRPGLRRGAVPARRQQG